MPIADAAARLAVLALRADVPGGTRTASEEAILVVAEGGPPVAREGGAASAPGAAAAAGVDPTGGLAPEPVGAVARRLAALPKPVRCTASVRDGHVVITATPCPAAAPDPPGVSPDAPAGGPPGAPEPLPGQPIDEEVAPGITVRRLHPDDPSLQTFDFLRERHGPDIDQLPVVCVGAGEALRTTAAAVHAWARDYRSGDTTGRTFLGGYSAVALDDESSAHTLDLLRTRGVAGDAGALLAGAAGVLRFALTDEAREVSWQLPPDAPHAYFCDDCGQRRAEHRILRRDADAGDAEHVRFLCEPCRFVEDVVPFQGHPLTEALLGALVSLADDAEDGGAGPASPDRASSDRDSKVDECAVLLSRYQEKLGLPLPPEWADFLRRHPPRE
jgi:hypothetical protein